MKTLEYSIPKGSSEIDNMHQAARFKRQDLKPASNLRCKLHNIKTKKKNCFFTLFFYSSFSKISHKCLLSGIILTWSQPNWVRRTHSHSEMREWENWPCDTFTFDFECFYFVKNVREISNLSLWIIIMTQPAFTCSMASLRCLYC